LQGQADDAALAALKELVAQEREDVRAWALLAMLTATAATRRPMRRP
jgi:hypothetical protein